MKNYDFDKHTSEFLASTNTSISLTLKHIGKHWDDEKHQIIPGVSRSVWSVTISRGDLKYTFDFGDSVKQLRDDIEKTIKLFDIHSFGMSIAKPIRYVNLKDGSAQAFSLEDESIVVKCLDAMHSNPSLVTKPSAYNILCCLTTDNPGTFEDFCSDYGYDTDSRKAELSYKAVVKEWLNISRIFNESELHTIKELVCWY